MHGSVVVTGASQGIGRAIAERLLQGGAAVVVVDRAAPEWVREWADAVAVTGDASDIDVVSRAADRAEAMGPLVGWVNNAAVFEDASLTSAAPESIVGMITANLAPAVVGCAVAVRRFRARGRGGSIVNVSSHQAQRAVRGALPYATAKAALEGLTRAAAVDHGPDGIRVNAVALGSIRTSRYDDQLAATSPEEADRTRAQMANLHPLGRMGTAEEVADTVAFLLSDAAGFVSGAVLPVDGGRAARGRTPRSPTPDLLRATVTWCCRRRRAGSASGR